MSEENLNDTVAGEITTRVIVELIDGLVSNVSANKPGVEVIIVDNLSEQPDEGVQTTVEHNGSSVDYVISEHRPDPALYDTSWEQAIIAGIRARASAEEPVI